MVEHFQYLYDLHLKRHKEGGDGVLFYVAKPYTVVFWLDGIITALTVPEGTATDFASIPKIMPRFLLDKLGPHVEAAVVHDYLCVKRLYTPRIAADIFLAGLEAAGVPWLTRHAMHKAVVLFGPRW